MNIEQITKSKHLAGDGVFDLPDDGMQALASYETAADHSCRWPIGEPSLMLCCGRMKRKHSPYCDAHHARAHGKRTYELTDHGHDVHKTGMYKKNIPHVLSLALLSDIG